LASRDKTFLRLRKFQLHYDLGLCSLEKVDFFTTMQSGIERLVKGVQLIQNLNDLRITVRNDGNIPSDRVE